MTTLLVLIHRLVSAMMVKRLNSQDDQCNPDAGECDDPVRAEGFIVNDHRDDQGNTGCNVLEHTYRCQG